MPALLAASPSHAIELALHLAGPLSEVSSNYREHRKKKKHTHTQPELIFPLKFKWSRGFSPPAGWLIKPFSFNFHAHLMASVIGF